MIGACLTALLAFPHSVNANGGSRVVTEERIESARGLALGTGLRAAATDSQAQAENPANLGVGKKKTVESVSSFQSAAQLVGGGAVLVDAAAEGFALGMSGRGLFSWRNGNYSGWEGRLSAGISLGRFWSIGMASRFVNVTVTDTLARPRSRSTVGGIRERTFSVRGGNVDGAVSFHSLAGLSISALGYNLVRSSSPLTPQVVGTSAVYRVGSGLTWGADALVDLNGHHAFSGPRATLGGGVECPVKGVIPLRGGYVYDQGRMQHIATGGVGFITERVVVELSARTTVQGARETTAILAVRFVAEAE